MTTKAKRIKSYVPEQDALRGKDLPPARPCREDCAVLLPGNPPQIVAYRSAEEIGTWISAFPQEAWASLPKAMPKAPRALLSGGNRCALLFGDTFSATGALFAIFLRESAERVARVLLQMGREDFLLPEGICIARPNAKQDEEIGELLRELLSCTDRAFSTGRGVGMRTRALLLAALAGYRIASVTLPDLPEDLSGREMQQIGMLLLCLPLEMRQRDGALRAEKESEEAYCITWRSAIRSDTPERTDEASALPRTILLPCFAKYRVSRTAEGFCIEIPLENRRAGRRVPLLQNAAPREQRILTLTVTWEREALSEDGNVQTDTEKPIG